MNTLRFEIAPSPETNDDEVRIFIDGEPLFNIDDSSMGLDPPKLFDALKKHWVGDLMIGRCICGVEGCGDIVVYVFRSQRSVKWETRLKVQFEFDIEAYNSTINQLLADTSWESTKRRVERLVGKVMSGTQTEDGLRFQWASTRIQENTVCLAYKNGDEQRVFEFVWDGETEISALKGARLFKREKFDA